MEINIFSAWTRGFSVVQSWAGRYQSEPRRTTRFRLKVRNRKTTRMSNGCFGVMINIRQIKKHGGLFLNSRSNVVGSVFRALLVCWSSGIEVQKRKTRGTGFVRPLPPPPSSPSAFVTETFTGKLRQQKQTNIGPQYGISRPPLASELECPQRKRWALGTAMRLEPDHKTQIQG